MKVHYCSWSRGYKETLGHMSADEAKKLHDSRELYFVVIGDDLTQPFCFLEINNTFFNIGFLDELQREYLRYEFTEVSTGKLFLTEAQQWNYEGDSDDKSFSILFYFEPNGKVTINKVDIRTRQGITEEAEGVDVSGHYEAYPDFGHYESLFQIERNLHQG